MNPKIIKLSKEKKIEDEGCLSCPNIYGPVERSYKVRVEATDECGHVRKINATDFFAKIIQHEYDHLEGILFIDKVKSKKDLRECKPHDGKKKEL